MLVLQVFAPHMLQPEVADPVHVWPGQADGHLHCAVHVCVPPDPHVRVVFGEQSPSFEHGVQSDHVPLPVLQVRVLVPHNPQPSTEAPAHFCPVHASSH